MSSRTAVYIIGAGPGDPGLLTVRGLECLRQADVVVHDDLVHPGILQHARQDAERISVGTAAPEPMAVAAIGYLITDKAREGRVVARLKWGDPFVFDGGGEEALFLHEQGVSFEVVPGLPAGIAVPTYAGIPVTYPGGGDTVTLVRGFEDENRALPGVDWASLARLDGTVVCYVGAPQLPRILDQLRRHGWSADDTAAVIYNGTTSAQHTVHGTLTELAAYVHQHPKRAPAILVLGRVVGFRDHLRWFDTKPLFGRRILVTRPRDAAAELADPLARLGAEAILAPMIRIVPPADPEPLLRATQRAGEFDWIVFTSANAVDAFMGALFAGGKDVRAMSGPRLCAVGTATAERLARYSIKVDLIPREFRAESLAEAILATGTLRDARVLVPRADIGRDVLVSLLRDAGALVTDVVAYRTELDDSVRDDEQSDIYRQLLERQIDAVTFTSASAVTSFATVFGEDQATDLLAHTVVACIGPVTGEAVRALGVTVSVQPDEYTIPALVQALAAFFATSPRASVSG